MFFTTNVLFAAKDTWVDKSLNWTYQNIIIVLALIVILGVLYALGQFMSNIIMDQKRMVMGEEMDALEVARQARPSFFKRMYDKAWNLIPMEKESEIDLGHAFDGIRELDNRLPPWWVYLFYGTIIWAIAYIYVSHYQESSLNQEEIYYAEMKIAKEEQKAFLAKQANRVDESNVVLLEDIASLESGQKTFQMHCSACHGMEGQGGVGPNLTDEYWIHGGSTVDVFKVIKYGVPEKGMIAWKAQLPPATIQRLTSFIKSIKGTNPPNGKAPQGVVYVEEASTN